MWQCNIVFEMFSLLAVALLPFAEFRAMGDTASAVIKNLPKLGAEPQQMLPYMLQKKAAMHLDSNEDFTLLARSSVTTPKEAAEDDALHRSQSKKLAKSPKTNNWESTGYFYPQQSHYHHAFQYQPFGPTPGNWQDAAGANDYAVAPTTLLMFLNLGILGYVFAGMFGAMQHLLHSATSRASAASVGHHKIRHNDHYYKTHESEQLE